MKLRRIATTLLSLAMLLSIGLNVEAKEIVENTVYEISAADFEGITSATKAKEDLGFVSLEDIDTSINQTISEEAMNEKQAGTRLKE